MPLKVALLTSNATAVAVTALGEVTCANPKARAYITFL